MEQVEFHLCKGSFCPYSVLTGKDIAKYSLGVIAVIALCYVLINKA